MKLIPHTDIETKKIYGCNPKTKSWWHEKGHIQFNNLPATSALKLWQNYLFYFWMISITLSVINRYMLFLSIPLLFAFLGIDVYEEIWCNKYAKEKMHHHHPKV